MEIETQEITAELLNAIIDKNEKSRRRYDKLYNYFIGRHEAIENRYDDGYRNPQKVVVNHARYITETASNFLIGQKIDIRSEKNIGAIIDEFNYQTIDEVNLDLAISQSWAGKALEYTFADEDSNIHTVKIDVRNGVLVRDNTVKHEKLFGMFYEIHDKHKIVTLADSEKVYEYEIKDNVLTMIKEDNHFFGEVPFVEIKNNSEKIGDFESVISLIDAYDFLQSDRVNDKEQLVDAILKIKGFQLDAETIGKIKQYRVMEMASDEDAEYLTKSLNENEVEVLRKSLETDIHKISMVPNMSDENFANNLSGVAMKYKLLAFEQLTKNKERYFEKALKERIKLYNNFLVTKGKASLVSADEIEIKFSRNLPINDYEIAQTIALLRGIVDDETLIQKLSFVDDASKIVKLVGEKEETEMKRYLGTYDDIED